MQEKIEALRNYYTESLSPEDVRTFDTLTGEMKHLTRQDQVEEFGAIYLLSGAYPGHIVTAAIGFTEKCIERGYRAPR